MYGPILTSHTTAFTKFSLDEVFLHLLSMIQKKIKKETMGVFASLLLLLVSQ